MASSNELIIKINGDAKNFIDEMNKVKGKSKDLEKAVSSVAKGATVAFTAFAAAIALTTNEFAKYETALVGVGKTTNIEGKKLEAFGKQFQKLAQEIPVSTNELLGIAQAAGQLGVTGEANLLKFTDTIAKLGVATDLTGEEAATALTRVLNVTGESIAEIDKFGSVIVALGNNFAATESEIVKVTTEVARSTAVFDVSSSQAAALATALKSVGVQAQLGGSSVGRSFRAIDKAIRDGGQSLTNLSKLTGIAGDQLKQTFEDDSTAVFQAFVEGLGAIEAQGGSTTEALASFGLAGDEILKVLPVLAKNSGILGDALSLAGEEAKNATALNEEAAKAFDTLASQAAITKNSIINLATNVGASLAPAIKTLLVNVNEIIAKFNNLDKATIDTIASFLKWGAIISGVVAGIATFLAVALKLSAIIAGLSAVFLPATVAASAFWVAVTGPIGLAVLGIAAITAGIVGLVSVLGKDEEPKTLTNINKKLDEMKKKRDALDQPIRLGGDPGAVNELDEQIAKLEELKKAKIEASNTAVDLTRRDDSKLDAIESGQVLPDATQSVVKTIEEEEAGGGNEDLKKKTEERAAIVDEATQKRIDKAKAENEALKRIAQERNEGLLEEDVAFIERKAAINEEITEAGKIKNDEERALAIEGLKLKHAEELAEIEEQETRLDDLKATRQEERAALDEELRELTKEQQALFAEEDLEALQTTLDSEDEAKKMAAERELNRKIAERNQFKKDQIKFGKEFAQINQIVQSEEVQGAKEGAAQLVALTNSKNATLKGIGKAASHTQAAIATGEGAIKAYSSLAGIPFVGPALGAAAAGAVIAFGVEQQATIAAAQTGGFVPGAQGGSRDRVPTLLEPGELVVPQAIAPNFIQAAGLPDTQGGDVGDQSEGTGGGAFEIMLGDRAGEFITLEQREGKALGLVGNQ